MTTISKPSVNVLIESESEGIDRPTGPTLIIPAPPPPPPGPPTAWGALVQGLNSGLVAADFEDVACDGTNFVAVAEDGYASRSTDGATWGALVQGLNSGLATARWRGVAAAADGTFVAVAQSGYAARSLNGGATWGALVRGLNSGDVTANFNRVATDGAGGWIAVGSSARVAYSSDNGDTWSDGGAIGGAGTTAYRGVCALGAPGAFLVTADNGLAGITLDGGQTFGDFLSPQGLNSGSINANFRDPAVLGSTVVVSGGGVECARSFDSAATWEAAPASLNSGNPGPQVFGALREDGQNVFVSVQENGYASYSPDQGTTWIALEQGLSSGFTGADWRGAATDGAGVWVAVAGGGYASISTP